MAETSTNWPTKWGLSDGYIRKIVKDRLAEIRRTPPTGQLSLDEFV